MELFVWGFLAGCSGSSILGLIRDACPGHWVRDQWYACHGLVKSELVASRKNSISLWTLRTKSSIPE